MIAPVSPKQSSASWWEVGLLESVGVDTITRLEEAQGSQE